MVGIIVMWLLMVRCMLNAWFQPIAEDDEIVIMPPIEGG